MKDTFSVTVLDDGMLSINTEEFTPQLHKEADEFVKCLGELMGGEVTVKEKRSHAKHHHHTHDHIHHTH